MLRWDRVSLTVKAAPPPSGSQAEEDLDVVVPSPSSSPDADVSGHQSQSPSRSTKHDRLTVLDEVSGFAKAGRLLAIMGSSGSGKTSLLDVLCSRTQSGGVITGSIVYNNTPVIRGQRQERFSYVPQDDHLLNTATIGETLETAALLKTSSSEMTKERLDADVAEMLSDMNLSHRKDFMIGGGDVRGISGGEKRRVSIAQELISSGSSVLMLDEPTTGLDSNTSEIVMKCILGIARKKNAIVIATIHQPNSAITSLFDDLMLLSHGKCVYFGPFADAVNVFASQGFQCPQFCNPTDYFLQIINDPKKCATLCQSQIERYAGLKEAAIISSKVASSPSSNYNNNNNLNSEEQSSGSSGSSGSHLPVVHEKYKASMITQSYVLTIRAARQWLRDPAMFASELVQYIFLALFLGGMYYRSDQIENVQGTVFNRISALFFIISVLVFTPPFTVLTSFALEKPLFRKERKDGMYRASSWLVAKTLVSYPVEAFFCIVFSCIAYFMVGFQRDAQKFFIHFAILLLFQLTSESMGLMFAVLTASPVYAIVWLSLVLIVMLSLAGFLTYSMPIYYQWIMDSNVFYFTLQALISNEFEGLYFDDGYGNKVPAVSFLPPLMQPKRSIAANMGILLGILCILRLLIWLLLVLENKPNKIEWILSKLTFGYNFSSNSNDSSNEDQPTRRDGSVSYKTIDSKEGGVGEGDIELQRGK